MHISFPAPQARGQSGAKRPKGRWQRWLLAPVAIIAIAAGGLWWQSSQATTTTTTTTATVSRGDLAVSVSGSGTIAAARTVDLPFQQSGTVTAVLVKVGDQVAARQALATIDAADLQRALDLAQANLATAEAQLAEVQGGTATEQDLASAQAQLASAQAQLEQTKSGTTTAAQLTSAQAQLTSAQAQLTALINPTDAALSEAQRQLSETQLALQSTRDSASQAKTNAEIALQNAVNSLTQAQVSYATAKGNWEFVQETGQDPTNPETTGTDGKVTKNKVSDTERQQYYDTFARAEAALSSAENAVRQAQVAYESARQNEVIQIQQAESSVASAQANLDALKNPTAVEIAQARATVASAQANLAALREGATAAELASAEAQVTQAQASLQSLTEPATAAELASAEAQVTQARIALEEAQSNLDDATLTAPFAGVVASVALVQDSSISAGASAMTIVDTSMLHVDMSLSESDAADVQIGQSVTLSFDALPDVTLEGTVDTIAPVATTSQNVVTYAVQVAFDPADSGVKVGMSATAEIQTAQEGDVLLVPTRAIQTEGDIATVTVQRGPQTLTIPVETGLVSDGKTAIVSSGTGAQALQEGDLVVIASASATSSTQSSTQSGATLNSLTGAGGPPSGAPPSGGPPSGP